MSYCFAALKKYAVFSGRARRKEYWFFYLFATLVFIALTILDNLAGTAHHEGGIGLLSVAYLIAVLIPAIAVTVRRLHDTNRTGWWFLLFLIPVIGLLVWLFTMIDEGTAGNNRYGPDPIGSEAG